MSARGWFLGSVGAIASGLTIATSFEARWVFAATGAWAAFLILVPMMVIVRYRMVSTWTFAALTIGIGVVFRGFYLSLASPTPRIDTLFFLGRPAEDFRVAAIGLLLGLGLLVAGYLSVRPRPVERRAIEVHGATLYPVAMLMLVVSSVATALYIHRTGGIDLSQLSAKRTVIPGLELAGTGYQSHGTLRFLGALAIFGHLLVLADILRRPRISHTILAILLLIVAVAIPFHSSVRTTVAMYLLFPLATVVLVLPKKGHRWLVGAGALIFATMIAMTLLRPGTDGVLDALVLNRNQIDLPKTAHLLHAVPGELSYAYGRTLTRWFAAPIPRELWPDKPVIPPGPLVGNTIYGQSRAGVPPSMVGELFWNLGWIGIGGGSFLIGAFLRWFDARSEGVGSDPFRAILYVVGPLLIGYEMIGSSLGGGLYQSAFRWALLSAMLWAVKAHPSPKPQ